MTPPHPTPPPPAPHDPPRAPWRATALTLFANAFPGALGVSIIDTARQRGLWALETLDIRGFATDKHASVDAPPAGGGAGMVLRADVLAAALDSLPRDDRPRILLTPRGRPLRQHRVRTLAAGPGVVLVCGRFEGVDQRVVEARGLEEISLGDVVLAGGELPAQALIESCVRLLPGVLGCADSPQEESFEGDVLEYPHYTRPRVWEGREIPTVLTSGDHAKVAAWRRTHAEDITRERRPDLWARRAARLMLEQD